MLAGPSPRSVPVARAKHGSSPAICGRQWRARARWRALSDMARVFRGRHVMSEQNTKKLEVGRCPGATLRGPDSELHWEVLPRHGMLSGVVYTDGARCNVEMPNGARAGFGLVQLT